MKRVFGRFLEFMWHCLAGVCIGLSMAEARCHGSVGYALWCARGGWLFFSVMDVLWTWREWRKERAA